MKKMIQDIEGDDESGDNHIDGDSNAESYDDNNDDHSCHIYSIYIYIFSLTCSSEMSNISHAATNEHPINFLSYKLIWISAAYLALASAIEKMMVMMMMIMNMIVSMMMMMITM